LFSRSCYYYYYYYYYYCCYYNYTYCCYLLLLVCVPVPILMTNCQYANSDVMYDTDTNE